MARKALGQRASHLLRDEPWSVDLNDAKRAVCNQKLALAKQLVALMFGCLDLDDLVEFQSGIWIMSIQHFAMSDGI